MNKFDFLQILIPLAALIALTPLLGSYMAKVFQGENHLLKKPLGFLERLAYRLCFVDEKEEMGWKNYAVALVIFNLFGFLALFALQMLQGHLPLNPQKLPNVSWDSSFNTAVSYMTNTNWQGYSGETTMSYLTQMLGLCVQNFLSAATGIAVFLALVRGIIRKSSATIGNFWVDVVRSFVYVLLPLSFFFALVLVWQGSIQNFSPYVTATGVEGTRQVLPMGPAASQIAIKQLGTNGGGFFNANSAHPFENPTPLTNLLELVAILLIPSALVWTYGIMLGKRRQGAVILSAMFALLIMGLAGSLWAQYRPNASLGEPEVMEGIDTRTGVANCVIWSVFTTAASNGSVNCMHESLSPISGGVPLVNLMVGEVIFGGAGVGLAGMLVFMLITVFLSGLMVGRTPEYIGKKIEAREVQMSMITVLAPSAVILIGSAVSLFHPAGLAGISAKGPHGFTEVVYAFTSAAQNNGSAFAGLNANTPYYNVVLGLVMLVGRFLTIVPVLAIAGSLAQKKCVASSESGFRTDSPLFFILLVATILVVGVLTHFPSLALGPVVEHYLINAGWVN
ncbi:MAG: potassium-transporting ATPase subunit KdpA [Nitrospinae bacterium]|nr:potassium-transporting ATPase subunit KdpA [Nitrospinota bacterium]